MGGSSFFGPGRSKNLPHLRRTPHLRRSRQPPPFPSSVRSSTHSSGPKVEGGESSSIFGVEDRRLKMGGSSFFDPENRRTPRPFSIFGAEDWVEDRHRLRGGKKFTEIIRRRYNGQQPGTKSARGPADYRQINRWSTAGFVLPSVYIGFPLFVLPENRPGGLSSMIWKQREWLTPGRIVPSAPPRPAAPPCAAPPRPAISPGFGTDKFEKQYSLRGPGTLPTFLFAGCRKVCMVRWISGFMIRQMVLSRIILYFYFSTIRKHFFGLKMKDAHISIYL